MSRSRDLRGQAASSFSGKEADGSPSLGQHQHTHYLFEDNDGDGLIDHLSIWCPAGLDDTDLRSIGELKKIWTRDGGSEWHMAIECLGNTDELRTVSTRFGASRVWESATPYLLTRHPKRSRSGEPKRRDDGLWIDGPEDQIHRDLRLRHIAAPQRIEMFSEIQYCGRTLRPNEFRRSRSQRPRMGANVFGIFARLYFAETIMGPLSLGGECHFGLGSFRSIGRYSSAE